MIIRKKYKKRGALLEIRKNMLGNKKESVNPKTHAQCTIIVTTELSMSNLENKNAKRSEASGSWRTYWLWRIPNFGLERRQKQY